ncbi:bifunctional phosphopantothenoylcysteine decarboxylase/phosphopantothenate--cysteine ligase CoaBC [Paenalkalicoccus suaedae]|uniref:Coenzyme A biosynthesis bifunctional protein CoaBC n=1 Tax=Paenalkalicoccus suaedae TaxID=2592382 RepID=A0A859FEG8_9BACI|nr:bifunctional phosphopantothenoylcysteine decarboxylase/phosphopantothenate--cysteine ligase CoaBC [Paenalkalicoccus suaedae]QKS71487.1 bifunctional phosphopantothenoylcysteine decarboxylase/phosphopantothenate--cysteine ligase CoaBC [Paenalkalicoccus suaedae]
MTRKNRVLLAVTGGIAAFKAAALTSKLVQANFDVKVMMTNSAQEFVTPLTFQALSRDHVYTNTFIEPDPTHIAHIDIADWADLVLVAPASANTIGKLAHGIADDMVTTTMLATTAEVMIAPAMNVHMYSHPAVTRNMEQLKKDGFIFVEPNEGYLACGYTGKGRMAEPEDLLAMVEHYFIKRDYPNWHGKKLIVTAGPTQEVIDPVRFLSNRSSGKMGFAIAQEAAARGAHVTLISGPVELDTPHGVNRIDVTSAEDMYKAVMHHADNQDVIIKAAAVSDYKPKTSEEEKMKKSDKDIPLEMVRTKDILKDLGQQKKKQILVGFAAESSNIEEYAKRKLETKNADIIAANSIVEEGHGFRGDTNALTLFTRKGDQIDVPLTSKKQAAKVLLDEVEKLFGDAT